MGLRRRLTGQDQDRSRYHFPSLVTNLKPDCNILFLSGMAFHPTSSPEQKEAHLRPNHRDTTGPAGEGEREGGFWETAILEGRCESLSRSAEPLRAYPTLIQFYPEL